MIDDESTNREATAPAFQDRIPGNHCYGCGPENDRGLRIKSRWVGPGESTCTFVPDDHHNAGPAHILNGGIIATLIDCHCVCTAIADAYRREGRDVGSGDPIWYATGNLNVSYLAPAPLAGPVELRATIRETSPKKTLLECSVRVDGRECARGEVVAIRVPAAWGDPAANHPVASN